MNYCSYELLSIVYDCESMDLQEKIPSTEKIRMDKEFSKAMDFLLEKCFLKICRAGKIDVPVNSILPAAMHPQAGKYSLRITEHGIRALTTENRTRVILRPV